MSRIVTVLALVFALSACAAPAPIATPTTDVRRHPLPTLTPTPTQTPQPTFDPTAGTAQPGDILVYEPGEGERNMSLGISLVELYALTPQTGERRLLTTIASPPPYGDWVAPTHDGRYLAIAEPPGITLLDLQAGEKTAIVEFAPRFTNGAIGSMAWGSDGSALYYSTWDWDVETETAFSKLWRWDFDTRQSVLLDDAFFFTLEDTEDFPGTPELELGYPLPDGRLMVRYFDEVQGWGHALYDPVSTAITPLLVEGAPITVQDYDPATGRVLLEEPSLPGQRTHQAVLTGQLNLAAGTLTNVQRLDTDSIPGGWWMYGVFVPGTGEVAVIAQANDPERFRVLRGSPAGLREVFSLAGPRHFVGWLGEERVVIVDSGSNIDPDPEVWLYTLDGEGWRVGKGYVGWFTILGDFSYAFR